MASLVPTWIIVCAIACAIAITSIPTTGQTIHRTALTGSLCRVSSISERTERFDVFPRSKHRHRLHRRPEPVVFVISTSPFVHFLLIIRGGDVCKNPGPADLRRHYTHRHACTVCGKGVTARSRAISCDSCDQWTHSHCAHSMYVTRGGGGGFNFLCNRCSIGHLTFADVDDIFSLNSSSDVGLSLSDSISRKSFLTISVW